MNLKTYSNLINEATQKIGQAEIELVINIIRETKGLILVCGNGGSHSIASHFSQDLNKAAGKMAICGGDATPFILATANDKEYADIFLDTYEMFKSIIDLVIVISGSGNSENIIKLLEGIACPSIAFVGFFGGEAKDLADYAIHVNIYDMRMVESGIDTALHYVIEELAHG